MFTNIEACGEFHRTKALFSNKQPRFRAGEFPSGSDFGRGQKRFPLRLYILKILCCTLPFYPRPWERTTSQLHFFSTVLGRTGSKDLGVCAAPYPLPFTTIEPSAMLRQNLPARNSRDTESPLCPRGPGWCCTKATGKPSKILNEWAGSMHHYRHKTSHCDGLLEVSCVTF